MTNDSRTRALTEHEAAAYLGLSPTTLAASRLRHRRCEGPPFLRFGRAVRYDVQDLDRFLDDHRVTPRSAPESGR